MAPSRILDFVVVVMFVLVVSSVPVLSIFGFKNFDLVEKRPLAAAPQRPSSARQWQGFAASVDGYLNDHFSLRSELISMNSYLHYRMGVSSFPRILVGSHGWLFFVGDPDFKFIRGRNKLSSSQIDTWLRRMEARQQWLAERNARFLILPAPVKETIYREYLPDWLQREAATTLVDQLEHAAEGHNLVILDVRKPILARKTETPVYGPYDSHWNAEGAFVAYRLLVEQLRAAEPRIQPLKRESLALAPAPPEHIQSDLANMLAIRRFLSPQQTEYRTRSTPHIEYLTSRTDPESPQMIRTGIPDTPRLMLVGDSYSFGLLPYLEDTFGVILWRHIQDGPFPQADMERFDPDIVLLEVQEGGLGAL